MENNVKIIVLGTTGSGKSTIAQLIKQAIIDRGIECNIVGHDVDDIKVPKVLDMIDMRIDCVRKSLKSPLVIEMVQARRSSFK